MMPATATIIGAAHRDQTIRLITTAHLQRTNPAQITTSAGGVGANIARHMAAGAISDNNRATTRVHFLGVANHDQLAILQRDLQAVGIKARLAAIDGPAPSYTAIIDNAGDLVIGAACMDLYDAVTPDQIVPHLPRTGSVIIDANFPEIVLGAIAKALPLATSLFAAGTSVEKVARLRPVMGRLDGLSLNRAEAAMLVPDGDTASMAQQLCAQMRPRGFVLVSDGGDAAALAQDDVLASMTPPAIRVDQGQKNVNGAGDVMAALLFARYINGASRQSPTQMLLDVALSEALAAGAAFAAGD